MSASVRDEGAASGGYGRFGSLSRVELERFFHLDDEDRRPIAARRRDSTRPGFALQLVTVTQMPALRTPGAGQLPSVPLMFR
ncbi:DUF4158 domain-containing protein [Nocardia africana]